MRGYAKEISEKLYNVPMDDHDIQRLRKAAGARANAGKSAYNLKIVDAEIMHRTVAEFKKRYPEKSTQYSLMWEKTFRDMRMNLRFAWQSVALDDGDWGNQIAWWWFRTILNAFAFDADFVEDGYRIMQDEIRRALPADEADPICSMIDVLIDTLIYEPTEELSAANAKS